MKRGIYLTIVLILGIAILAYISNHSKLGISPINYGASLEANNSYKNSNVLEITSNQLDSGEYVSLIKGNIAKFNLDSKFYYFSITEVSMIQKRIGFLIGDIKLYLSIPGTKKIDLNNDDNYELEIKIDSINEGVVKISFKKIFEKTKTSDFIDSKVNNAIDEIEKRYNYEFNLFIIVFGILLLILALYLIIIYLVPFIRHRNILNREKPSDALKLFGKELVEAKKSNNTKKVEELESRIKHLHNHMN